jgi:GNAT superfamily N-acetyltransferase
MSFEIVSNANAKRPIIRAKSGGQVIGKLTMKPAPWGGEGYEIEDVRVNEAWQRQGVATRMLEAAEHRWGHVRHSPQLTEQGRAWSDSMRARPALSKLEQAAEPAAPASTDTQLGL